MTAAQEAWPHFVPRLELSVEIRAVNDRIDELYKRFERFEAKQHNFFARFEELLGRCGGEGAIGSLATRSEVAALELKLGQRIAHEASELTVEIEDLRGQCVTRTALSELQRRHSDRLDNFERCVSVLQEEVQKHYVEQEAASENAKKTFALQAHVEASFERLHRALEKTSMDLQNNAQAVEALASAHRHHEVSQGIAAKTLEELEVTSRAASSGMDALRQDVDHLFAKCNSEFVTNACLDEVVQSIANAHDKIDFAMMDRATLRHQLEHETEMTRQILMRYQSTFQDLDKLVERMNAAATAFDHLETQSRNHATQIDELKSMQQDFTMAFQENLDQNRAAFNHLEDLSNALQQEFQRQADKVREVADGLTACSTRISLEQLDQTLGLRTTLLELEQGHAELKQRILQTA